MVVVDTNVLVYAADADAQFHNSCRTWLVGQLNSPTIWYTTWPILYEFMRISTHPKVMRQPWNLGAAWSFVTSLLASNGLELLVPGQRHADVATEIFGGLPHLAGNILHDAHTAVLMREHGVRDICTRDTDFHRFPFLRVIDPLEASESP